MTIEMKSGDDFVYPDVPEDLEPWDSALQKVRGEEKEAREGRSEQGQNLQVVPTDEKVATREQARALLAGKSRWRPGWEKNMTGTEPRGAEVGPTATV